MKKITLLVVFVFSLIHVAAQEDPYVSIEIPAQNMLKFNRFMINPTFSTVRENKSYINVFHRNQWIQYDEAFNTYLLSYSGRVGDKTGLGLSLYGQNFGTISNFGVLANYAYGLRLAENTVFTFGLNLSYYKSGFDQNQSITTEPDPRLAELQGNSLFSVQPGFNLAIGDFDVGFYAENLFDYNIKTSKSLTGFSEKTFSGHLQYTKQLKNSDGLLNDGRLLVLARGRKQADREFNLSGSLMLDLPRLGWIQGGFDDYYGASIGLGFNLNKRISLGYTFERGVSGSTVNLGPTHEISFAYSFQPTLTDNMVLFDDPYDSYQETENQLITYEDENYIEENDKNRSITNNEKKSSAKNETLIVKNNEIPSSDNDANKKLSYDTNNIGNLTNKLEDYKSFNKRQRAILEEKDAQILALQKNVEENNMLIDEILFMQDSLEKARIADEERRFAQLMQLIKRNSSRNVAHAENKENSSNPKPINAKTIAKGDLNKHIDNEAFKNTSLSNDSYKEELKKNNIKSAKLNNLRGVQSGYYMIANVFATEKYRNNFMDKLNGRKLDPKYFLNHKNNWNYVYLKRYDTWQEAVSAHKSNINGTYSDDMWIMNVDNGDADENLAYNQKANSKNVAQVNNSEENIAATVKDMSDKKKAVVVVESKITDTKSTVDSEHSTNQVVAAKDKPAANNLKEPTTQYSSTNNTKYREELKKNKIKGAVISDLKGVQSGYYMIANVFATEKYRNNFMDGLNNRKLDPNYFVNHKNDWKYVYLKRYDTWQEAVSAYKSNINGTYSDDMWIMNIDNGDADENYAYATNSNSGKRLKQDPKVITASINHTYLGYYLVVNVFSQAKNAERFLKTLQQKGIDADYFVDPKNNYRYIYIKKSETLDNALYSYHTNLNSQYFDDMWILHLTEL